MLHNLSITNFALIESLDISFSSDFSIITGETGAGKSILLGALGLVLGNRADLSSLKNKEAKCIIEAQFSLQNYNLESFFVENDLDYDSQTIIRREILPSGKSRAFINDSPVNLTELQNLSKFLIDIHSQHETRDLVNEDYQTTIIDQVAKNSKLISAYQLELVAYKKNAKILKQKVSEREALAKEQEYNNFLLTELLALNLKPADLHELEAEAEQLSNVELIKENLDGIFSIASEEEIGVLAGLQNIKQNSLKIKGFSESYVALSERLESIFIELQDVVQTSYALAENIVSDPERLEFISNKLQTIYNLFQKHQVKTVEELLVIQNELDSKVVLVDDLAYQIEKLEKSIALQLIKIEEQANLITQSREKAAPELAAQIQTIITQLGMADAVIVFDIQSATNFLQNGKDVINLLFSGNKGVGVGPIKKVASGGEMSRIMLAVKSILANYSSLPTIIFDEIDTGVSGEIALKIGEILKKMSKNMQVFAITHLPQIAAKGSQHYKVFKFNQGETTLSELKLLSAQERVTEIAEMLSGKDITESALQHAKALLQ